MMEFYAVQIPEILALKLKYLKVWQKFSWYEGTETFYPVESSRLRSDEHFLDKEVSILIKKYFWILCRGSRLRMITER